MRTHAIRVLILAAAAIGAAVTMALVARSELAEGSVSADLQIEAVSNASGASLRGLVSGHAVDQRVLRPTEPETWPRLTVNLIDDRRPDRAFDPFLRVRVAPEVDRVIQVENGWSDPAPNLDRGATIEDAMVFELPVGADRTPEHEVVAEFAPILAATAVALQSDGFDAAKRHLTEALAAHGGESRITNASFAVSRYQPTTFFAALVGAPLVWLMAAVAGIVWWKRRTA